MSGHSKWATTKHKKAALDAKRGKLFAKLIKNIEVAARVGGPDPAGEPDALRRHPEGQEVLGAERQHRSCGQARRGGPGRRRRRLRDPHVRGGVCPGGGVALLVECLTDNKNRAVSEVRLAFSRNGGNMADSGSVSYMFERKGVVEVPKGELTEDALLEVVLESGGAEEINDEGESFEILSEASDFVAVRTALQEAGIDYDSAEAQFVPPNIRTPVDLDGGPEGPSADRRPRGQRRRPERLLQPGHPG